MTESPQLKFYKPSETISCRNGEMIKGWYFTESRYSYHQPRSE